MELCMTNRNFFLVVFVVKEIVDGRWKFRTISTYVAKYANFEYVINKFSERFERQAFTIMSVTAFVAETDFTELWDTLKQDATIPWSAKNKELARIRPDIEIAQLYTAEGFTPRAYR